MNNASHPIRDYGDVRDLLQHLPHRFDGDSYMVSDIFTSRFEILRSLDPQPRSVYEFGALFGYFLVTAVAACPSIKRVGWCDNEVDIPRSNYYCDENVFSVRPEVKRQCCFRREDAPTGETWDVVSVDSGHSFECCLADLEAAEKMRPRLIFVDDYTADGHAENIGPAVARYLEESAFPWELELLETVNGLAVLRRS